LVFGINSDGNMLVFLGLGLSPCELELHLQRTDLGPTTRVTVDWIFDVLNCRVRTRNIFVVAIETRSLSSGIVAVRLSTFVSASFSFVVDMSFSFRFSIFCGFNPSYFRCMKIDGRLCFSFDR
jgi:hypothetical protein